MTAVLVGAGGCAAARAQAPAADTGRAVPEASTAPAGRAAPEARTAPARPAPEAPSEARGDADEVPDLAFLEYLGSWQADDDEWLLIAEWHEDEIRDGDENGRSTRTERRAAAEAEARSERAKRKDDEEGG